MSSFFAKLPMKIRHDYARCSAASGVGGTDLRVGVAAVLGLASYYRKFVKGFANVAALLHRLLEKGAKWDWSKACQFAFDAVNCAGPRIYGLLSAVHRRRGRQRRTLTKAERRYCATRREMLSVVWALRDFRSYIYGQRFLFRGTEPKGQVAQWLAGINSQYYWRWNSGNVHTFCRTCTQCTRRKLLTKKNRAPMQAVVARYPLQRVGMDILVPLEKTKSGNRCVLVLMDNFYKWTVAFQLAKMEANTVAKRPKPLISSAGGVGDVPAEERFSGALLDMLSIMFNRYSCQCDCMLPFVMLANNRSDHESPGVTPAIAILGRESRLPLDVQIRHPPWGEALGLPDYIRET
ncbi:Retrovirus-related Pol polyprotein from transposon [Trichinella britovi]|uniref:Retrovirus-related Pol polyprotein from transposon n=1 Tax=Trichinella britovi TaxID=45882 RepID=A0A0V1C841_TRIBR|nr:Retrovirus-related Pol polyprotein from transposon [Trichinella britovi]